MCIRLFLFFHPPHFVNKSLGYGVGILFLCIDTCIALRTRRDLQRLGRRLFILHCYTRVENWQSGIHVQICQAFELLLHYLGREEFYTERIIGDHDTRWRR